MAKEAIPTALSRDNYPLDYWFPNDSHVKMIPEGEKHGHWMLRKMDTVSATSVAAVSKMLISRIKIRDGLLMEIIHQLLISLIKKEVNFCYTGSRREDSLLHHINNHRGGNSKRL